MKIQTNVLLHHWILLTTLLKSIYSLHRLPKDIMDIIPDIHVKRTICGSELADTLSYLCTQHNYHPRFETRVKRQIVEECCKVSCTYYYLIKYYCRSSKLTIEDMPDEPSSSASSEVDSWTKENNIPVEGRTISPMEHVDQSSGSNYSGQVRKSFTRRPKIKGRWGCKKCHCRRQRGKDKSHVSKNKIIKGGTNRPPARLGLVQSTRPPIIWPNAHKLLPAEDNIIHRSNGFRRQY